ncbi:hypothetical protein LTR17_011022 [Elasticomyces elasticus]|nr:hypothetical protein LTR17_011022 [Elasticomyces elasticus]
MPKAEVGSTKYLANKMKAKGLQRLRWYCQACEKQCRDENGFKQHTMSEGHVRAMLMVGEDPRKAINDFSNQFKRDFLSLLKTSHGEKKVSLNGFYQEYIHDKEHVHMNSTKWPSLTEFAKYLGREGICRVEEGDRGLEVQWVDDSADAIQRREDIKKKERLAKGDESMESRLLEQQIKKARKAAEQKAEPSQTTQPAIGPEDAAPVKVSLSLGGKAAPKQEAPPAAVDAPVTIDSFSAATHVSEDGPSAEQSTLAPAEDDEGEVDAPPAQAPPKTSLSLGAKPKHTNPLMKKNPLSKPKVALAAPVKKVSNAERIMKEELERKRIAEQRGGGKRQRLA